MQHNGNALNSPPPHENNLGKRATSLDCITNLYIITPNSEIARPWPELSRQLTHSPLLMREKSAIIALRRARSKSIFRLHAMRLFTVHFVIVWDKKKRRPYPLHGEDEVHKGLLSCACRFQWQGQPTVTDTPKMQRPRFPAFKIIQERTLVFHYILRNARNNENTTEIMCFDNVFIKTTGQNFSNSECCCFLFYTRKYFL